MDLVKRGADCIYNLQEDSALYYIDKVKQELPDHPLVPLMEGLQMLWMNIPVLSDSIFDAFILKMQVAVEKSQSLEGGVDNSDEALFFELAARGLMAEHYAEQDLYMKALSEANKAYGLIKKGFEKTDEISEFLFTSGLYNYFREKYPQIYPIYKPFVWVFKSGDKALGLQQLHEATYKTIISKIEANIYISYIYLRYEDTPEKAQEYLSFLVAQYPNNLYLLTKYLESLRAPEYLDLLPLKDIIKLQKSHRHYFRLAGNVFRGLYEERINRDNSKAFSFYSKGIEEGKSILNKGEFYKSLGYLGMGRILHGSRKETSKIYLNKALEFAETKDVKKEARSLLRK